MLEPAQPDPVARLVRMSGESSTSKISNRLVPSWRKRATSSSSKGTSSKTAPSDVPRIPSLAETPSSTKTAFLNSFRRTKQEPTKRILCKACANLTSVFDDSSRAARDTDKEGASHIYHHSDLISLLECSAVCPLCALIVKAVPRCLEWSLWGLVRKVVFEGGLNENVPLQEWKIYLENPHSGLLPPSRTAWYSSVTKIYMTRVRSLNLPEDIPLAEILSMIQEEMSTGYFGFWTQVIRIREQYAMKGQFWGFCAVSSDGQGRVCIADNIFWPPKDCNISKRRDCQLGCREVGAHTGRYTTDPGSCQRMDCYVLPSPS
ncbi:hypothetical protein NA56DRAFT_247220 [Hyaloscypha hepaticicola]|uniref:Uncharacterized protein n=1 Tax=Hyaloscypha hepaticicola TaxID=2082293 RepID=A0A2J6PW10_9HELO|nr:hypothetical protein NA56DRAFT_247220 [Hyaloscypha hepaticicola]